MGKKITIKISNLKKDDNFEPVLREYNQIHEIIESINDFVGNASWSLDMETDVNHNVSFIKHINRMLDLLKCIILTLNPCKCKEYDILSGNPDIIKLIETEKSRENNIFDYIIRELTAYRNVLGDSHSMLMCSQYDYNEEANCLVQKLNYIYGLVQKFNKHIENEDNDSFMEIISDIYDIYSDVIIKRIIHGNNYRAKEPARKLYEFIKSIRNTLSIYIEKLEIQVKIDE